MILFTVLKLGNYKLKAPLWSHSSEGPLPGSLQGLERVEEGKKMNYVDLCRKSFPGKGNGKCKGPAAETQRTDWSL